MLLSAPSNPLPTVANVVPNTATRGGPAFTLTANGSDFLANSSVQWNGSAPTTSFVSSTQVTAQIFADDISVAGTDNITVSNPARGVGTSGSAGQALVLGRL